MKPLARLETVGAKEIVWYDNDANHDDVTVTMTTTINLIITLTVNIIVFALWKMF